MNEIPLYPLRFEPIYQYRLWGGRRLANVIAAPLPGDGPIGEAWLLSEERLHEIDSKAPRNRPEPLAR